MKYKPMKAKKTTEGKDEIPVDGYVFEEKFDGIRALFEVTKKGVTIFSRSGRDISDKFPELVKAGVRSFRAHGIYDAEICCLDDDNRPHLYTTVGRSHMKDPEKIKEAMRAHPAVAYVFDILEWCNVDLRSCNLEERLRYLRRYFCGGSTFFNQSPDITIALTLRTNSFTLFRFCIHVSYFLSLLKFL